MTDGVTAQIISGALPGTSRFPAVTTVSRAARDSAEGAGRRLVLRGGRLLGGADALALAVVAGVSAHLGDRHLAATALATIPALLLAFKLAGLYDREDLRIVASTIDETPALLQLTGLVVLCLSIAHPVLFGRVLDATGSAVLWPATFISTVVARALARAFVRRVTPVERCLVIGDVSQVERLRERLATCAARAHVVACLPISADTRDELDAPEMMRHVVNELRVDRVIIAPSTTDAGEVIGLIRAAKAARLKISVISRMLEGIGSGIEWDDVNGVSMLGIRRFGLSRSSLILKRTFDVIAAIGGLLFAGPLIAAIAVAIKLDSPGPVFFRQVRVGRNGQTFRIVKFRSMVADAEARKDALRVHNQAGEGLFKLTEDPRITRVGQFLRSTSLDELPQIFNVLLGEMSLVGPRPLVTDEDAQVLGADRSRLYLTPGMTGPWQVLSARVPLQEMVGIDYRYVAGWSLWLDVKILLQTMRHVVRRGNV